MQICNDNIFVNLNEALKQKRGEAVIAMDYSKVANSTINVGYLNGEKINRAIFYLRSKGCEWSCKFKGGCFMCGHYFGTSKGRELPKMSFVKQFKEEYEKHDFCKIPMICIYNAGSILNDKEMPNKELIEILELVNKNKMNIKRIVIESRPEFINYDILAKISETCKGQTIEIGMGLETADDIIRNKCINKGFTFQAYKDAVSKIKKFDNIKVLTYITVKPLFLSIEEGIDDVVKSIREIAEYTDIISLEPVSIQKNTLIEYLYERNLYTPPIGWMIKDIMLILSDFRLLNDFDLRIGGFEFFPIPDLVISNCENCNKALYDAIDDYNSTKRIDKLVELDCGCFNNYTKLKTTDFYNETLDERISNIMNTVLKAII